MTCVTKDPGVPQVTCPQPFSKVCTRRAGDSSGATALSAVTCEGPSFPRGHLYSACLLLKSESEPGTYTHTPVSSHVSCGDLAPVTQLYTLIFCTGISPLPVLESTLAFGCKCQTPNPSWLDPPSSLPPDDAKCKTAVTGQWCGDFSGGHRPATPTSPSPPLAARVSGRPSPGLNRAIADFLLVPM